MLSDEGICPDGIYFFVKKVLTDIIYFASIYTVVAEIHQMLIAYWVSGDNKV